MDESKKAAKAFVDQYFPVRDPNPKSSNVFGDLFSPNSNKGSPKKQGYGFQNLNAHSAAADGKSQGNTIKTQSIIIQKGSNVAEHCEISEPCLMSSSVDYGCRDNYPYNPDNRYPGPSAYIDKDRKDGSEYAKPEAAGAEWWQGSFYY